MRSIITCLMLFCFQSFLLHGKEKAGVMQLKKVKHLVIKNQVSVKKNYSAILQTQFDEILPIVYHDLKAHDIKLNGLIRQSQLTLTTFMDAIRFFKTNAPHSYTFIFKFFCPKHAFW